MINRIKDYNRSVLSDKNIIELCKKGLLIEKGFIEDNVQPNSVDLTLSNSFKILRPNSIENGTALIDIRREMKYDSGAINDFIVIKPKEFVLMSTNEVLNIPNGCFAIFASRSSVARVGIITESAGIIDVGFRGSVTLEIFNEGDYPVKLYTGMRIGQVYFFKSEYANEIYGIEKNSKYNGQVLATESKIHLDKEFIKDEKY